MFNLYTYEKRLKDKKLEETEKISKKIKHKLYIKKRDHLAGKFYKKINNFILDIVRKPIIINNNYYKQKEKKQNNSFSLFKFQTDKQRIEKVLNSDKNYNNKNKTKKLNRCQSNIAFNNKLNNSKIEFNHEDFIRTNNNYHHHEKIIADIINQPSMKFKPRNDLERIIDTINKNKGTYLKNRKYLSFKRAIYEHKKENDEKEMFHNSNNLNDMGMIIGYGENNHNMTKNIFSAKKNKLLKKKDNQMLKEKINLSNAVKNMTERYHTKTYFNSIEQAILLNNEDKKIFNKFQKYNKSAFKKLKMNNSSSAINFFSNKESQDLNDYSDINRFKSINKYNYKKGILFGKDKLIDNSINNISLEIPLEENDKKYVIEKILKLNKPISPDNKLNNSNQTENENLKILKSMAINKSNDKFPFSSERRKSKSVLDKDIFFDYDISINLNNKRKEQIIEDEEYILLNNHIYNKNNINDIKKLGKFALKKCHFINDKFNNEKNNQLIKGQGKLMITNGLSLKQFVEKYSLPKCGTKK